jgi:DNA-binding SARP family transcriptional activator
MAERNQARAARLLGAAQTLRASVGVALSPDLRVEHDQAMAAARAELGEAEFAEAWAEGQAMDRETAVAYGLAAATTDVPDASQVELRIFALGPGRVLHHEQALAPPEWTYARARELFFYLLTHAPQTKAEIGLTIWPEASPAQLRNRLGVTLHALRKALGQPEWIVFEDDAYAFNRSMSYWFDVEAFEAKVEQARRLLRAGSGGAEQTGPARAISLLDEAASLYQGDFLADLAEGDWLLPRRAALREKYLEARLALGSLYFDQGDFGRAVENYRQALAREPYLEAAHRGLMECLARQGEPGLALRHYQTLADQLRQELGAPPDAETEALADRLRRGEDV